MRELFKTDYYTLDLIPQYRQDYITIKLNWLIELLGLKESHWPLDCVKLLNSLKSLGYINLECEFVEAPEGFDGQIKYYSQYNLYTIIINKNNRCYPFESSQDRRLNFTAAHELGHLALGHTLIPDSKKTDEEIARENLEADEFAGRLLMPERLIFNMNYYSLASAAEYLKVSKKALWTRLNNLKRLHLLHSRPLNTCRNCGNTSFSPFSLYCGICGEPLKSCLGGMRKVFHPSPIQSNHFKRALECPLCKSTHIKEDKCLSCGTYIFNYCTDYLEGAEDGCDYANPSSFRFCELCGKPTYYSKRGILGSWEEDLKARPLYA